MTRFLAAAVISMLLPIFVFVSPPAHSQSDPDSFSDSQCFPWQVVRDGHCVAKPTSAPLPPAPPPVLDPCTDGTRNLSGQCKCPPATHPDAANGNCVADAIPASKPNDNIVCGGGRIASGTCICPDGFNLMAAGDNEASGGTCVRTHAENCLGGALTVSGTCLCNGQVVMSGETYALEYVSGKCVPKRCPLQTLLKDGKCIAISATASIPLTDAKAKPASPAQASKQDRKQAVEAEEHGHSCGHGMARTHSGCVAARRHHPAGIYGGVPTDLQRYYRSYQIPGNSNAAPGGN